MIHIVRKCFLGLSAGLASILAAGTDVSSIPGWSSDFHATTNRAIQSHVPLVMIWGNRGCSHCQSLEASVQSTSFAEWRENSGYEFCFVLGQNGKDPSGAKGARKFAGTAGGTKTEIPDLYPFVCLYWVREDGMVVASSFTTERATYVREMADGKFSEYSLSDAFSFTVSDTAFDRLEVTADTPHVDVPMRREVHHGGTTAIRLVAEWPNAILPPITNALSWGGGVTQQLSRISLSRGDAVFPVGRSLSLRLLDDEDATVATGAVHFVDAPGNSVLNPKFVGEPFEYGEWTMDYETAKRKGGYVLANFSGVLWCPDCNGIESTLFSDERFKAWAVENKVSLVLFDQGQSSSPATAVGSGKARLLSYASGDCYYRDGMPLASGAAYLSRKAITQKAAEERITTTTRFTHEWLPPESTSVRLGNPTLLLVKDDKVLGRANLFSNDYSYDVEENLARLSELLALADGTGDFDNYASTSTRTIADGGCEEVSFQINDRSECFRVTDLKVGSWSFCVTNAPSDVPIAISVWSGNRPLKSGTNGVSFFFKGSHLSSPAYVKLAAYPSDTEKYCADGRSTAFAAELTAACDVSAVDETGPTFEDGMLKVSVWNALGTYQTYQILNLGDGKVTLDRKSGKLPSGLSLKYDATMSSAVLSGTANAKSGVYTSVYRIRQKVNGKTRACSHEISLVLRERIL